MLWVSLQMWKFCLLFIHCCSRWFKEKNPNGVWCQSCHFIHNRITFLFGPSVFTLFSDKGTSLLLHYFTLMLRKNLCIFIPRIRLCLVKNTVNVVTYFNNKDSQCLSVALHYQWAHLLLLLFTPENSHPGKVQVASSLQSHRERKTTMSSHTCGQVRDSNWPHMHVFRTVGEDSKKHRGNQRSRRHNMQTLNIFTTLP